MNKRTIPAIIIATLAAGATAAAPYYDVNITQQLCTPACVDETPVFAPKFSVKSIANVGTSQYIIVIHVEGVINYIPCNCGSCCTRSQVVSQDFTIPVQRHCYQFGKHSSGNRPERHCTHIVLQLLQDLCFRLPSNAHPCNYIKP